MKFRINKRHNEKTGRAMNNEQFKYPIKMKNRKSLNFVFLFSQMCKNGRSLFFSLGNSVMYSYACD